MQTWAVKLSFYFPALTSSQIASHWQNQVPFTVSSHIHVQYPLFSNLGWNFVAFHDNFVSAVLSSAVHYRLLYITVGFIDSIWKSCVEKSGSGNTFKFSKRSVQPSPWILLSVGKICFAKVCSAVCSGSMLLHFITRFLKEMPAFLSSVALF